MKDRKSNWIISTSISKMIYFSLYIIFTLSFIIWSINNWNIPLMNGYERILFPWVFGAFIIQIMGFIIIKKVSYVDVVFWYIILSYMFMFGHIFLNVFKLKTTLVWSPGYAFSDSSKYHASIYVLLSICSLYIGYLRINTPAITYTNISLTVEEKKVSATVGWLFLVIGFIANVMNSLNIISVTQAAGTYTAYVKAASSGLVDDFAFLMIPGIIYILCSRTLSQIGRYILLFGSISYYAVTMMLSGSRKTQLFTIITITICFLWTNNKKKLKVPRLIILVICALLLLNLIYVIRDNRTNLTEIIPVYIESIKSFDFIKRLAGETLAETGLTFYSVAAIVQYVPNVFQYEAGMTIIRALPSILPIGWLIGDFVNKAASTYVINRYTGIPVGASLFGDYYWNFGLIGGIVCSFFWGYFFAKLPIKMLQNRNMEPYYFSLFFIMMLGVRCGFFEIVRPLVLVTIVPIVIKKLLIGKKKKIYMVYKK